MCAHPLKVNGGALQYDSTYDPRSQFFPAGLRGPPLVALLRTSGVIGIIRRRFKQL